MILERVHGPCILFDISQDVVYTSALKGFPYDGFRAYEYATLILAPGPLPEIMEDAARRTRAKEAKRRRAAAQGPAQCQAVGGGVWGSGPKVGPVDIL